MQDQADEPLWRPLQEAGKCIFQLFFFYIFRFLHILFRFLFRKLLISPYLTKCFSFEQFLIEIYFTELVYFTFFLLDNSINE